MIIQCPCTVIQNIITVQVFIFHITRPPGIVIFGLVGHRFTFRLYDTVCYKSPYLSYFFTFIPVIDTSAVIFVFKDRRTAVSQAESDIIRQVRSDMVTPTYCQFKTFGRQLGIITVRNTCSQYGRNTFSRSEHIAGHPVIPIKNNSKTIIEETHICTNVQCSHSLPGQVIWNNTGNCCIYRQRVSDYMR